MYTQACQLIDARIQQRMREARTPSLALGLTDRHKLIYTSVYGYSELESKTLATPDTLYEIGSISKAFAAVVTLRTAEAGFLQLDTPVADYLPWFEIKSKFQPITIHHLLSHTGGLPYSMDFSPDPRPIVYALRYFEVPHAPGERFHYSEVGYQIITLVLEEVHRKPYTEILKQHIFKPLGMTASAAVITHDIRPNLARGYTTQYDDRPTHWSHDIVPAPWIEFNSCDGAIASTAEDMTKFMRMLLNQGTPLISANSFELMTTEVIPDLEYGYGLFSWEDDGIRYLGHAGDMPGYEAYMWMDITNHLGVVVLSSMPTPSNLSWDVMHILQATKLANDPPDFKSFTPAKVDRANDYAGKYQAVGHNLSLVAEGDHLFLDLGETRVPLEKLRPETFLIPHPDFDIFPLVFLRNDTDHSPIKGCNHGSTFYVREGEAIPENTRHPPEWEAFVGHYRSWNPWLSNFRIILRNGDLILVHPNGEECPLIPSESRSFRVGYDELTPEFISFNQIPAGQALQANLSGVNYYRFFTP